MLACIRRLTPLTWLVALLLAATLLRLAAWREAPPGLRFDEMLVSYHADLIGAGARPIYLDDLAEEPLYHYLFAAAQSLIAPHLFTLRWLSLALSLVGIAATYTLGRQMFNRRVGLLAAALATVAFWSLLYSRIGLRLIALPAFLALAMIFLWHGLQHARRRDFILAGLLFGLSAYTYSAARMLPILFLIFAIYLALFRRAQLRRHGLNLLLMLGLAALIVLPMAIHIATVPAAERRLGEVQGPLDALAQGDLPPLINSIAVTLGMFNFTGDPEWLYNIPNRPVFDLLTGALFVIAVLISLRRLRQPAYAFVLIWLFAGLLPAMLTWPAASNSHGILAQTPAFLLAAIGLDALTTRWPRWGAALTAIVLIVFSVYSIADYFGRWAANDTVRREHQAGIAAVAPRVAELSSDRPVVFSSGAVTHWEPWSVTTFRMTAPLGYTATRWFDARSSFIFPQGQTDLTLINAALDDRPAPLDSRLIEDLFPTVEPLSGGETYSATHLISALNTRLITLTQASVSWPREAQVTRPAQLPVQFSDRLELIGYDLRRTVIPIGRNIRLTTYWRAQQPLSTQPTSIFVHVLDKDGNIVAQLDSFTIAPEYVQAGDIIVQVHFIPIPPDFIAGEYQLALGRYAPKLPNQPRLSIEIDGQPAADRILLQPVSIVPP